MIPANLSQALDEVVAQSDHHSLEETLDYFRSKYGQVRFHDRDVFLFTNERSFGNKKHIVTFHVGPSGPTPEHIFQYVLITYCYRGTFPMTLDGERVTLQEGDCLLADRHCPHAVDEITGDTIAVNIVLKDRFFEKRMLADLNRVGSTFGLELVTQAADHTHWRVYQASDALSRTCVDQILCETLDPKIGSADIVDDLCAALITNLLRSNERDVTSLEDAEKDFELIGRVHEYVSHHYRDGRLQALAEEMGYDASYLSAYIKSATARTFKQLINIERMRHATLMLRSSTLPVSQVAQMVGVTNLTSFYKRFKEYTGKTPREYRNALPR